MANKPKGFDFTEHKDGGVVITHNGRFAIRLKASKASKLLQLADAGSEEEIQMEMAKLTGNYKRGNERMSKNRRSQ